jgi:hypothetical protein
VPQGVQDVRRGIFLLAGMHRRHQATMAFGLNVGAYLSRGNRQDKDARWLAQQHLSRIVSNAGELNQAMSDQGGFPNEHGRWLGMLLVPGNGRPPRPPANRKADDAMGDAVCKRVPLGRRMRFKHRPSHVPLEQVDPSACCRGQVCQLMNPQTFSGSR